MATNKKEVHIVMLPWSAFGHMLPFLELAIALANHGVRVSYISTPRNISRLPKIPPNLSSLIQYVTLPMPMLPNDSNLPEGAEATIDVEFDEVPFLKRAYDLLYEPVKTFISTNLPTWIISDFAAYWIPQIAEECRVQLMYFSIFNAATMCFLSQVAIGAAISQPTVGVPDYVANQSKSVMYSDKATGITDAERVSRILKGCHAIGIRSCREFEHDEIDLLQSLNNKLVVPVGMLPPAKVVHKGNQWLDRQRNGSVIYVAFGSESKLTKHQVDEIAYGLELAQLPFIWALRKPTWAIDDSQVLPPDLKNRISDKGIVCIGWAPQLEILAHPSVGGSLFHCGWASIIETMQHGHTPILLPLIHDQFINARVMVQKGFGIEVERREDGSFTRNDIAHALRRSMVGDEAEKFKARAKEAAGFFSNQKGVAERYVSDFVEFLKEHGKT
ncbi:putative UDP-rhamnose:rhamnosyltransferase 1 [Silene latifolia]|uniref:putative UDP-rhamnose:rhamnosyltransferase 1 n=1 Tax=Silene latifolia TaxID=37657 RepID=UPI003D7884CE